ncbi:MAG: hypothetical protein K2O18_14820, partial [Oscillospiraceae bacterium]|nr:hypothetical protein [Oscillospiraceae bacterium]
LRGGDSRCAEYIGSGCGYCRLGIGACPAGALSEHGINMQACAAFRSRPENQIEIAQYSHMKCMKCMEVCPAGQTSALRLNSR